MSSSLLLHIITWLLLDYYHSKAYIIDCLPDQDCYISCDGTQSCMNSIMNCPISGDCNIECYGTRACQDTIINASHSSGHLNILCAADSDDCRRMKIYGSKLDTNTGDLNLTCNGGSRSCISSEIDCPATGDCTISCNGDTSCPYTTINGPVNGHLDVYCNGNRACFNGIFNGLYSFEMAINGCTAYQSCLDLSIWCPSYSNNSANCFIEGNDNLGRDIDGGRGIRIYAINGWKDVDINYYGNYTEAHDGQMFCGYAYDTSCDIATDSWSCAHIDDYCNHLGLFESTTPEPTEEALIDPIMSITPCHTQDTSTTVDMESIGTIESVETMNETAAFDAYMSATHAFQHGSMGMFMVGGILVFIAVFCVIFGMIRKEIYKRRMKKMSQKKLQKKIYVKQPSEIVDDTDNETDIDTDIEIIELDDSDAHSDHDIDIIKDRIKRKDRIKHRNNNKTTVILKDRINRKHNRNDIKYRNTLNDINKKTMVVLNNDINNDNNKKMMDIKYRNNNNNDSHKTMVVLNNDNNNKHDIKYRNNNNNDNNKYRVILNNDDDDDDDDDDNKYDIKYSNNDNNDIHKTMNILNDDTNNNNNDIKYRNNNNHRIHKRKAIFANNNNHNDIEDRIKYGDITDNNMVSYKDRIKHRNDRKIENKNEFKRVSRIDELEDDMDEYGSYGPVLQFQLMGDSYSVTQSFLTTNN